MSSSAEANPEPQDAFHRLLRTIGGRIAATNVDASSPPAEASVIATPSADSGVEVSTPGEPLERTISNSSSQKIRMNIAERLKKLSGKLKKTDKGVPSSPKVTLGEIQPPDTSDNSDTTPGPSRGHAKLLSMVAELDEPGGNPPPAKAPDPPEPDTLAKRIQTLIDSLPFPTPRQDRPPPIIKPPKPPARERDGRPIPPPNAIPIKDSRLIAFLSSATIMNGSSANGRPSIWSVLEGIGAPAHGFPPLRGDVEEGGGGENGGDGDDSVFSEDSSVMIYSPLLPGQEDLVELAELVPISVEEEIIRDGQMIPETSWTAVWPLSIFYSESSPSMTKTSAAARRLSGDAVISPGRTSIDAKGRRVRVQTVRAWVPSTTKLSVQAMWWGYRLYLPPPVLDILSDKTIEAAKRAAMITTALTWFFNNLPINALPPAVRPAAILLQRIVPYLGYIGTFISWSWSTIKSYDVGYGVTLTATWLLPIALIPGTWHEYDFPKSPSQSPAPLPPPSPPSEPPTCPSIPTSPSVPPTSPPTSPPPTSPPPTSPTPLPSPPSGSLPPQTPTPGIPNTPTIPVTAPGIPVEVPVPPTPVEPPPVPPTPIPVEVSVGSPLMDALLKGPVMPTVPLPDEDAESAQGKKLNVARKAKALFARSPKVKAKGV